MSCEPCPLCHHDHQTASSASLREEERLREIIFELYGLLERFAPMEERAQLLIRMLRHQETTSDQPISLYLT